MSLVIGVDWDGTVVMQDGRRYDDLETPEQLMPGVVEGLLSLKLAGHTLGVYSARLSPCNTVDPRMRPRVLAGLEFVNWETWPISQAVNRARVEQIHETIRLHEELWEVFSFFTSDKGGLDLMIDDKALRYGLGALGAGWDHIARVYGAPPGS